MFLMRPQDIFWHVCGIKTNQMFLTRLPDIFFTLVCRNKTGFFETLGRFGASFMATPPGIPLLLTLTNTFV